MREIKEFIYKTLDGDEEIKNLTGIVGDNQRVFFLGGDKGDIQDGKGFICYSRISEKVNRSGKRVSIFQISVWNKNSLNAEKIKDRVIYLFNGTQNKPYYYCFLDDISEDFYDSELKIYGINLTFIFIAKN